MNVFNNHGKQNLDAVSYDGPPRKRAKYVQTACNECKRRKLKCSGEPNCWRCVENGVDCVYPSQGNNESNTTPTSTSPRSDTLETRLASTEAQLQLLSAEVARLRQFVGLHNGTAISDQATPAPVLAETGTNSTAYVGPTSNGFGLNMVKSSLALMDSMPNPTPSTNDGSAYANLGRPVVHDHGSALGILRLLGEREIMRLLDVYEVCVGISYPCLDIESVKHYATDLLAEKQNFDLHNETDINSWYLARDLEILKVILATALVSEGRGEDRIVTHLATSVESRIFSRISIVEVDMKELLILVVLCFYYFFRDEEVLAYRVTGFAARGCFELGLHRQDTWSRSGGDFPGELQRTWAVKLFWCIYVLDRRWSFGTGMPFAFQDSDIDTNLPEPDASAAYLNCMIAHGRLIGKIWTAVMSSQAKPLSAKETAALDLEIQTWRYSVPSEYRFMDEGATEISEPRTRVLLQALMELRANQMRIVVHRDHLISSSRIFSNEAAATLAVEVAKETIELVNRINNTTDLYSSLPGLFNYFVVSSLGVLFLAVCHAPALFSSSARNDYHMATELLRSCSNSAKGSPRLRKLANELRSIGLKLGLSNRTTTDHYPQEYMTGNLSTTDPSSLQLKGNVSVVENLSDPCGRFDDTTIGNTGFGYQTNWDLGDLFLAAGDPFFSELGDGISDNIDAFPDPVDVFGVENDQHLTDIIANLLR